MSILINALRRAEQPPLTSSLPLMGIPMSQAESPRRRWLGWCLAPLALLMGAGANYGWHLYHLTPIEQHIDVKEVVHSPFVRVEPKAMITRPLPLPAPVIEPKAVAITAPQPPSDQDEQNLAERLLQALNNTPLVDEGAAPQIQSEAGPLPLGAQPLSVQQQVPPLTYGAHNFSSDPAKRAVVLNGREYHEGSEVASRVTLAAIGQDYLILQVGGVQASLKALQDWQG